MPARLHPARNSVTALPGSFARPTLAVDVVGSNVARTLALLIERPGSKRQ
jgi:hypothetical protein